jgi:hypothetical protein
MGVWVSSETHHGMFSERNFGEAGGRGQARASSRVVRLDTTVCPHATEAALACLGNANQFTATLVHKANAHALQTAFLLGLDSPL